MHQRFYCSLKHLDPDVSWKNIIMGEVDARTKELIYLIENPIEVCPIWEWKCPSCLQNLKGLIPMIPLSSDAPPDEMEHLPREVQMEYELCVHNGSENHSSDT